MKALCVAIHDVAPATWPQCQSLIAAVQAVAALPLGLLVVPRWHGSRLSASPDFCAAIDALLADGRGHEMVLHGLFHRDDGPPPSGLAVCAQRRLVTRGEGEFAALDASTTRMRLGTGLADLRACGWRATGFVPPAWMLSAQARAVLQAEGASLGLHYASLFTGLLDLRSGAFLRAPVLVYSARWRATDALVRGVLGTLARCTPEAPLLRLGLHPADAQQPATLRHAQRLVERALRDRHALTEAQWCHLSHGKGLVAQHAKG